MAYQETRVKIPHPNPTVRYLVGIIRSVEGSVSGGSTFSGSPSPIALICHGILAHKNQTYHCALASALSEAGIASIRFDFQGYGESPGESPGQSSLADLWKEEEDFDAVFSWLEKQGWRPDILIAHSKASNPANAYLCDWKRRRLNSLVPPFFVNISGRYVMARLLSHIETWKSQFDTVGYVEVKHGNRVGRGTKQHIIDFATFPSSRTITDFPKDTHVLTIHGTKDEIVPFNDAEIYHLIFSVRDGTGTSELKAVEGADHNFVGKFDILIDTIIEWLLRLQRMEDAMAKL
ncbi:alpha/beta-hydrolase [Atractiella rhizophila]|nr:alpha/beta-hydrolase [Atractiella rhizophila]